jgi:hypothetical protein
MDYYAIPAQEIVFGTQLFHKSRNTCSFLEENTN